jgi:hypothetical protein
MEEANIPPLLDQIAHTKLGIYCSERLSVDLYSMIEVINLLLPVFDKKQLKEEFEKIYGKDSFDTTMKKLKKAKKLVTSSKTFYDAIADKTLVKKSVILKQGMDKLDNLIQKAFTRFFYKTASKIEMINQEVYELFVFLIMNSSIKRREIKAEYFKNLEQKDNRRIPMDRRDRTTPLGGF